MYLLRRVLTLTLVVGASPLVLAGFTSPKLALLGASAVVADGARSATIQAGELDFSNTVQGGTALHLVVFQGTAFVRYPLYGSAVSGTSTALANDQIEDVEVSGFLSEGSAAPSGIRIVALTATTLTVTLPANFSAGACRAQLLTLPTEGVVVSNVVPFTLP